MRDAQERINHLLHIFVLDFIVDEPRGREPDQGIELGGQ
jgi:hypothetical protein